MISEGIGELGSSNGNEEGAVRGDVPKGHARRAESEPRPPSRPSRISPPRPLPRSASKRTQTSATSRGGLERLPAAGTAVRDRLVGDTPGSAMHDQRGFHMAAWVSARSDSQAKGQEKAPPRRALESTTQGRTRAALSSSLAAADSREKLARAVDRSAAERKSVRVGNTPSSKKAAHPGIAR